MQIYSDKPKDAVKDGVYRYALSRRWLPDSLFDQPGPPAVFCMLNPSTADGDEDDATTRVCIGYAKRWGAGGLVIVNPHAYSATDPADLVAFAKSGGDIVGPRNGEALAAAFELARAAPFGLVAGWGAAVVPGMDARVAEIVAASKRLGFQLTAIATTKQGHPVHPLRKSALAIPQPWSPS